MNTQAMDHLDHPSYMARSFAIQVLGCLFKKFALNNRPRKQVGEMSTVLLRRMNTALLELFELITIEN